MSKMCVYLIHNLINDKRYIGIAKNGFKHRYRRGGWSVSTHNKHLKSAALKYGLENFKVEILEDNIDSYDTLLQKENEYILKFNSISNGYNKTTGGRQPIYSEESNKKKSSSLKEYYKKTGGSRLKGKEGAKHTEKIKKYLSEQKSGKPGRLHTDAYKLHMSKLLTGRVKKLETCIKHSEFGKTLIGGKNPNAKQVYEINSGLKFDTINNAAIYFNINRGSVSNSLKYNKQYKTLLFKYVIDGIIISKDHTNEMKTNKKHKIDAKTRISANNPKAKQIREANSGLIFDTIKSAAAYFDICRGSVSNSLKYNRSFCNLRFYEILENLDGCTSTT